MDRVKKGGARERGTLKCTLKPNKNGPLSDYT